MRASLPFGGMMSALGFLAGFAFMALGVGFGGWAGYWRGVIIMLVMAVGLIGVLAGSVWLAMWLGKP